jgi:hypothetical protein
MFDEKKVLFDSEISPERVQGVNEYGDQSDAEVVQRHPTTQYCTQFNWLINFGGTLT